VKRVPASFVLGNENNEVAQVPSGIVGMWARCFPALGGIIVDSLSGGCRWRSHDQPPCSSWFRSRWSISLTFKKLTNWLRLSAPDRSHSLQKNCAYLPGTMRSNEPYLFNEPGLSEARVIL